MKEKLEKGKKAVITRSSCIECFHCKPLGNQYVNTNSFICIKWVFRPTDDHEELKKHQDCKMFIPEN